MQFLILPTLRTLSSFLFGRMVIQVPPTGPGAETLGHLGLRLRTQLLSSGLQPSFDDELLRYRPHVISVKYETYKGNVTK